MTPEGEIVRRLHDALRRVRELEEELVALLDVVDPEPAAVGDEVEPVAFDREPAT